MNFQNKGSELGGGKECRAGKQGVSLEGSLESKHRLWRIKQGFLNRSPAHPSRALATLASSGERRKRAREQTFVSEKCLQLPFGGIKFLRQYSPASQLHDLLSLSTAQRMLIMLHAKVQSHFQMHL